MSKSSVPVKYGRPTDAIGTYLRGWHEPYRPLWVPHIPETWDATRWAQAQDGPRALAKQR